MRRAEAPLVAASPFIGLDDGACIERVADITDAEFERRFWRRRPVVLRGVSDNAALRQRWTRDFLRREHGATPVVAKTPFTLLSERGSEERGREVRLAEYLDGMASAEGGDPDRVAYLFDRGAFFSRKPGLAAAFEPPRLQVLSP